MDKKPTIANMMAAYAADAVQHAKEGCNITLDYTPGSIRLVEHILETLRAGMPRGFLARLFGQGPSQDNIETVCKMYGGYIGEVVRRTGGGEWVMDTEISPGRGVISLRKGDSRIFPPEKVQKRLANGTEDNVWSYYQVLMKDLWK